MSKILLYQTMQLWRPSNFYVTKLGISCSSTIGITINWPRNCTKIFATFVILPMLRFRERDLCDVYQTQIAEFFSSFFQASKRYGYNSGTAQNSRPQFLLVNSVYNSIPWPRTFLKRSLHWMCFGICTKSFILLAAIKAFPTALLCLR